MHKRYISMGAALAGLAVALGAFGAHGLKKIVPPEAVDTFQTGVQYQMIHALALILAGILVEKFSSRFLSYAAICFGLGILLFSGSLYLLTYLKATSTIGLGGWGLITPVGGLAFILGWVFVVWAVVKAPYKG
ncbi:MAG: hypothetical protein B7Z54_03345 [Sphingobacteriales bacterium 12-47-4]|nr:MAG: hypothetical protein B7Z54_03345 [Sphingobacteriales bacterium 12-47-4]